ncbi:MAG TPA: hypothetical protein VGR13_00120, partial [Actinomycetota bacterium]|nr:hypothetical protein [Actinomycetota bacterium]
MGARIESLPIPAVRPGRKGSWLVAGTLAVCMAAGLASYLALRNDVPASSPSAAYENSGAITGTGPALQELAGRNAAYENSGAITGSGPALQELAARHAAYKNSGLISGTGPSLAELRGVDVINPASASVFPSVAALERQVAPAAIGAGF